MECWPKQKGNSQPVAVLVTGCRQLQRQPVPEGRACRGGAAKAAGRSNCHLQPQWRLAERRLQVRCQQLLVHFLLSLGVAMADRCTACRPISQTTA